GTATVTFIDNSNNAQGKVEDSICESPVVTKDPNNFIYVTCTSPAMPVGTYEVELTLDTFGRVLTENNAISYTGTAPINNITTMQQMTTDICKTMPIGMTKTLQDTRGSYNTTTPANYGIIKAKDNNCWMTDNLNLYNRTVTSADTDMPSGSFTIPDTSNWRNNIYDAAKVHRATNTGYTDQVYYNWCSAIALTTTCSVSEQQNSSICPKNWQLPIGGFVTPGPNKSWQKLLVSYGVLGSNELVSSGIKIVDVATTSPYYGLGFKKYYGKWASWSGGTEIYQGENVEIWSGYGTTDRVGYAQGILIQNNNYNGPMYSFQKGDGESIRCVAR
ncbi:hypothetical protein IKG54_00575, partial [Candidatus Saccharibacteria bacterium]|nr:hypothetical protein [Candidatus Saccharibacteria bacterium]